MEETGYVRLCPELKEFDLDDKLKDETIKALYNDDVDLYLKNMRIIWDLTKERSRVKRQKSQVEQVNKWKEFFLSIKE